MVQLASPAEAEAAPREPEPAKPQPFGSYATVGLFVLASVCTLYFTRDLFLPVLLAVLLKFVLAPVMRVLRKARVPAALGAALVLLLGCGLVGWALVGLAAPARDLVEKFPASVTQVQERLSSLVRPVEEVRQAAAMVEELTEATTEQGAVQQVTLREPSLPENLFANTQKLLATAAIFVPLLFFLLASEDLYLRKLVRVLPRFSDKRKAVEIANEIERESSSYLFGITVVNFGLGVTVGISMYLLDVPNPALWGLVAALANYVPYLGAAVGAGSLFVVSFLALDDLPRALLAAGVFLALTIIESTFVTPYVVERRHKLNPVAVFLGLFFWGFMWGIPGVLVAMPLMMILKIVCDRVEPLQPVGEFLGS